MVPNPNPNPNPLTLTLTLTLTTDAQRLFREVGFLCQMEHENVVQLKKVIKAENDKDLYMVFEFMETDLHATIRANILEDCHMQYITYQLCKALKYIHSAGLGTPVMPSLDPTQDYRRDSLPPLLCLPLPTSSPEDPFRLSPTLRVESLANLAVHRDIKPANLLLNSVLALPTPKLRLDPTSVSPLRSASESRGLA